MISNLIKFLMRKILLYGKIRNLYCVIRAFYFCKIKNYMQNYKDISKDTWKKTLDSNRRAVCDIGIDLPAHPRSNKFLNVGLSIGGGKSNWLLEVVKSKYEAKNFKNLKVLSVGPRSEGEIFNLFANGFEFKNIVGIDLFSYSPLIKLSDMHDMKVGNDQFDLVLMGWCLAYSNNKKKAIEEAKRVLKKNGMLVIGYTLTQRSDDDILSERGYLVRSPNNKINSKKDLDMLLNSCGLQEFYSKEINKGTSSRLLYGATF